jgi:ABC-type Mn2+/Zn2+ transport system ATPase subunit
VTGFETFEAREAAFNAAVGHLIPARYMGPQRFWKEFRKITEDHRGSLEPMPTYITSNPRDCLAFGTVSQVLAAAWWAAAGGSDNRSFGQGGLDGILEDFGLRRLENQPLRTLSGGETVRLSLAKTMLAAAGARRLVIASPFCWLSRHHLPLLEKVMDRFSDARKPVDVLIMQGESCQDEISADRLHAFKMPVPYLDFSLRISGLKINLGTPINAITAQPAHAGVRDMDARLTSPCLLVGDNGQGKSLVAKALCGAVGCVGSVCIESNNSAGRGRLLFQDVVSQTLLRSFKELQRMESSSRGFTAEAIFTGLLSFQARTASDGASVRASMSSSPGAPSLLEVKTMLIAVRLAANPAALVLDEPDWGLSRDAAIGLVLAVVDKAHQLGVPVILISHKPWWRSVAGSVIEVSKTLPRDAAGDGAGHCKTAFSIDLRPQSASGRKSP